MKRVGLAALAVGLSLAPATAAAEWKLQSSGLGQSSGMLDVCALGPTFAVAVGVVQQGGKDTPVVMISRDGRGWTPLAPAQSSGPLDMHIYTSVWFVDQQHGYIGAIGELFATYDGGGSWNRIDLGGLFGGVVVNDIHCFDPKAGIYAATSSGELRRSVDGGGSWPVLAKPLEAGLNQVLFVDDKRGWVTSGAADRDSETDELLGYVDGGLALTEDGGESWTVVFSGEERRISGISFADAERGWITSNSMAGPKLQQTSDGGRTWSDLPLPSSALGAVSSLSDVAFFDRCEGWLLGNGGDNGAGTLWRSVDGGESWTEVDRGFLEIGELFGFPIEPTLSAFAFAGRGVGWAAGTYESIFRYDADTAAPECSGGGGGSGDGGAGGGTSSDGDCNMTADSRPPGWLLLGAILIILARRRRLG